MRIALDNAIHNISIPAESAWDGKSGISRTRERAQAGTQGRRTLNLHQTGRRGSIRLYL